MHGMWARYRRKLVLLAGLGGTLLAYPGCGNHIWDYAIDAALGFMTSQALRGFVQNLPA